MSENDDISILNLPNLVLLEIFEYLTFDDVSKKRLVCRRFDQICQQVLNGGFNKVIKQHTKTFKRIKALLPRRESERRNHCLARHADILTSIETRISMLSMTYTKYMDLNLCCFIPGRVLDEIFRILRLIVKTNKPLRPHEVLQELRDISSMAIEHFDEKIAQNLKKTFADNSSNHKMCTSASFCSENRRLAATSGLGLISDRLSGSSFKTAITSGGGSDQQTPSTSSVYFSDIHPQHSPGGCPEAQSAMMYCKKLEAEYKKGVLKMHRMQQIQNLQNKRLQQTLSSVAELNVQIVELKKRLEDVDAKNREISANIRHINGGSPETAKSPPMCNNSKNETATNPGTESSLTQPIEIECINSNKRRCEDVDQRSVTAVTDDADTALENCELSPNSSNKKVKLDK